MKLWELMLFMGIGFALATAQIDVEAGKIFTANFIPLTYRWVGIHAFKDNFQTFNIQYTPIMSIPTDEQTYGGEVQTINVPGKASNGAGVENFWAFILPVSTTFSIDNLVDIAPSDLNSTGIFSEYGVFYDPPGYDSIYENPNRTFCCKEQVISFGLKSVKGYLANINGRNFTLFKYKLGASYYPVFYTQPEVADCYDGSQCLFDIMVPAKKSTDFGGDTQHYLYLIPHTEYNITVWIDGVKTYNFTQTALPYMVTIKVVDKYSGTPVEGVYAGIYEENGNNIFVPLSIAGAVSRAIAAGITNSSGMVSFVVAPTEYPNIDTYRIKVAVFNSQFDPVAVENMTVENAGEIVEQKKPLPDAYLWDNAKVTVNQMASIIGALYDWASIKQEAKVMNIVVDPGTGTYTPSPITLKTGAPNAITVTFTSGSGYVKVKESSGFLLLNPSYDYANETHIHKLFTVPTGTQFIITPTYYYPAESNVTLEVYSSTDNLITTINFEIDSTLDYNGGSPFSNDELKVNINRMASVIGSLYYALN